MEDDNNKEGEGPTTSKNLQNVSTDDDQSSQRRNSEVTVSGTYSNVSGVKVATTGPKKQEKKKVKQRQGRVEKRKVKRKTVKRKSKTRVNRRKRDLSVSTIFTRLPSSGYQTPMCNRCGHRCCLRSFKKKHVKRNLRKNIAVSKMNKFVSVSVQAGSQTKMLSPLFITTNSSLEDNLEPTKQYSEVTPEMIYQSLRRLTMWKTEVATTAILEYLMEYCIDEMAKRQHCCAFGCTQCSFGIDAVIRQRNHNYPVGSDKDSLLSEVLEKLRIAEIVGIVSCSSKGAWSLGQALQKRKLSDNHVTLFWKAYGDTLAPLPRPRLENKPGINEDLDNEDD